MYVKILSTIQPDGKISALAVHFRHIQNKSDTLADIDNIKYVILKTFPFSYFLYCCDNIKKV